MPTLVDRNIRSKKQPLLEYFRDRASELSFELKRTYADSEYKQRTAAANKGLIAAREMLIKILEQNARRENWSRREVLEGVLMITYTNYVIMMELRNALWQYEYMTFSRRIGELWEPFCQLCWEHPLVENLQLFVPPLFKDVREKLASEIEEFIDNLSIAKDDKSQLKRYYQKVWSLVTSGEIKLALDLHFDDGHDKYVVDFKSGFSSNEKGNTNRLLLVASVYRLLEEDHKCVIFVRSAEDRNNHYLQTLKHSKLWSVYCGEETYEQIEIFTGFDISTWMKSNVKWAEDFSPEMYSHIKANNLEQYLEW
ncbi:MAG: hypothetical protein CEE38_23415 [Planctomycetes bacterium B3_Pla]|nr:MAG: hypothetical protein CEE38_23415 [Planctomycetes bacterium B3_Pla]